MRPRKLPHHVTLSPHRYASIIGSVPPFSSEPTVPGVNEDRRSAPGHYAYIRNRRSTAERCDRGGIATAFRGRNVNRRAASRAVVRADGVDGRSRREWEREAQEAALSIIPAEQSHRLFPSAITSPKYLFASPFSSLPRARAASIVLSAVSIRSLSLRCSRSRDMSLLAVLRSFPKSR